MKQTLSILFVLLSGCLAAGWLPLWFDVPRRDNPHDPFFKRASGAPADPLVPTPTPVCSAGADNSVYGFEDGGLQGWGSASAGGYDLIGAMSNTAVTVCRGAKAICGSVTFSHAGAAKKAVFTRTLAADLSGKKLSATAYFPSGMSTGSTQAKMWIKSMGGFVYSNGPSANVPAAGGWVGLEFDLNLSPVYAAGATNTADVREIGVELYSPPTEPDGSFGVCLDAWDYEPKPASTPTPTFTPTSTIAFGTATVTPTISPTFSMTPTMSPTPAPICSGGVDSSTYGFEDSTLQGWGSSAAGGYNLISAITNTTAPACSGTKVICGDVTFTHAGTDKKAVYYRSYSGSMAGKKLTAAFYFPSGATSGGTQVKMWIKSTGGFVYSNGNSFNAPAGGGWLDLDFDLSLPPVYASGATNTADVREIGLEIYSPNGQPDGTFNVCMDAYNIP